ncbi:hypothetical protein GW17_00050179 [Ensete ventricosum]|nr:hypothetical protein GW17_00050179 [Ensete ventricosum]
MDPNRRGSTMVLWVFGYGSLVWNPGFDFDEKIIGFIKGYRRVFDLGKILNLKRVASFSMYQFCGSKYWGAAYCVRGDTERERAAMKVESHIVIETSLPYIVRSSAEPPFLFSSI